MNQQTDPKLNVDSKPGAAPPSGGKPDFKEILFQVNSNPLNSLTPIKKATSDLVASVSTHIMFSSTVSS